MANVTEPGEADMDFMTDDYNKDIGEKNVFDAAEARLDKLEGKLEEDDSEVCLMFEEEAEIESKVHDTLRRHLDFWRESGASDFAVSVVLNGYVPQMWRNLEKYEERNNRSYRMEKSWANEAVAKLLKAKLVCETEKNRL